MDVGKKGYDREYGYGIVQVRGHSPIYLAACAATGFGSQGSASLYTAAWCGELQCYHMLP